MGSHPVLRDVCLWEARRAGLMTEMGAKLPNAATAAPQLR
jgi:hypothetical protein